MSRKRLVSGIQPTGRMHIGNYVGAISNWVTLQDKYEAFFLIVDLHSLTSVYENPAQLREDKLNLAIDLLASGIDPEQSSLFYQSDVLGHSELHLIFSMMTPLGWLERVPTYKSKLEEIQGKDLNTYGFLGYPVLQAADILLYKGEVVPVGKDQLPHLELAREIGRRFNHLYQPTFPEAQELLTEFALLPGTDGRKMSKSYGNTIPISLPPDEMEKLVLKMMTDPGRARRNDPGNPELCPVFQYHKIFNSKARQDAIDAACRSAEIGCVDCKRNCAESLIETLRGFHQKRTELEKNLDYVSSVLEQGAEKARAIAEETMQDVRRIVGL